MHKLDSLVFKLLRTTDHDVRYRAETSGARKFFAGESDSWDNSIPVKNQVQNPISHSALGWHRTDLLDVNAASSAAWVLLGFSGLSRVSLLGHRERATARLPDVLAVGRVKFIASDDAAPQPVMLAQKRPHDIIRYGDRQCRRHVLSHLFKQLAAQGGIANLVCLFHAALFLDN